MVLAATVVLAATLNLAPDVACSASDLGLETSVRVDEVEQRAARAKAAFSGWRAPAGG
jgi:hypothetical protein